MRHYPHYPARQYIRFNSKRCDYEPHLALLRSMWLTCFNSKRCDYEPMRAVRPFRVLLFQFQKVRLWVVAAFAYASVMPRFQFQKVRLWAVKDLASQLSDARFNSKRCDYEENQKRQIREYEAVSIPKGAIMRHPFFAPRWACQFQFQKVRLWVVRFASALVVRVAVSIPKGAIMSKRRK